MKKFINTCKLYCFVCSLLSFVVIHAQPKAAFTSDVTKGCSPLLVNFINQSTGNPTEYSWDLGNGAGPSYEQSPSAVFLNSGNTTVTYTVKLLVKNTAGQDSVTKEQYITVYANPQVNFIVDAMQGCSPLNVKFTDQTVAGSGNINEWLWDFGDGHISKEQKPSYQYTLPGKYNVSLTVSNNFGCRQTMNKDSFVYVGSKAKADFNYEYSSVCQSPASINFNNLSQQNSSPVTYQWVFGDGGNSAETSPNHVYNNVGNYNVQLITLNSIGCKDTIAKSLTIGKIGADFEATTACTGSGVVFTSTSTTVPAHVTWNFGDGATSTTISANHSYANAGTYAVTIVADFGSCTSTKTKQVVVNNKPTASFTNTKTDICQLPYAVTFTNSSIDGINYSWKFGDGDSSKQINPQHSYTKGGFYNVTLIATAPNGCADTVVQKNAVRVGPPKINALQNLPQSGCAPEAIFPLADVTSAEPVTGYMWDFGDGITSAETKPQHQYDKPGVYDVKLKVTTAGGCSDTITMLAAVKVLEKPKAAFSATPLNTCAKTPLTFTDASTGKITESHWYFGDGGETTKPNPQHKYADTGFFTVTLIVRNESCTDSSIKTDYVYIRPPVANFTNLLNCTEPLKRTFTDKSIDAKTWRWDFGDGSNSSQSSPVHSFNSTGTYNVQLIVTNDQCTDTANTSVKVIDEHPAFNYTMNGAAACRNDVVNFTATNFSSSNISTFNWLFGDGTSTGNKAANPVVTHQYATAGIYAPQLIIKDMLGCSDTVTNNLTIKVVGAKADFKNPPGVCINTTVEFTDQSAPDGEHPINKWVWTYGEGAAQSYSNGPYQHLYGAAGYYDIKLVVYDSYGCKDSVVKSKAIQVTDPKPAFSVLDSVHCTNNNITFKNSSQGEALQYIWNFGDGTSGADVSPVHTYRQEGIFAVQLTATDKYGCKNILTKDKYITISDPKASFKVNGLTEASCPPLVVTPDNLSADYLSLSWNFGDGSAATLVSPTHVYTQGGEFDLQLIAKGHGECYDTAHQAIKLKGPSGNFSYNPLTACKPAAVTFNATTKNAASVIWDYNDGVTETGVNNAATHTYKSYGRYVPKLLLTDNAGCHVAIESPDTLSVAGPTAAYAFSAQPLCDSTLTGFVGSSQTYYDEIKTYQWSFDDGRLSVEKSPSHYYQKEGTYNVKLKVITKLGCADSVIQPINIIIHQTPSITVAAPDSLCVASTAQLSGTDASNDATLQWKWSAGATSIGNAKDVSYTFGKAGSYQVKAVATTINGCADSASQNVFVVAAPDINAGIDSFVCQGSSIILNATGASNYTWTNNSTLSCTNCAAPTAAPAQQSAYIVSGKNAQGCEGSDTVNIAVINPEKIRTYDDTLCLGEDDELRAEGATLYQWLPALYLDNPESGSPVFHAAKDTTIVYQVTGMDEKKCFSDTKQLTVKVYPVPHIEVLSEKNISVNIGSSVQLSMKSSPDVTEWRWEPQTFLNDATIQNPVSTPKQSVTYTCVASNKGSCFARDQISVSVMCNQANMFVPNTFSPNGDGMNDRFFPRGKGVFNIKSMRVFNRWGQVVYQRNNFLPNEEADGWDGTFKGEKLSSDVYVYMIEITCDNNSIVPFKGNVTLLR